MSILIRGMEMPNHCGECGIEWCERWKRLIVAGMPSAKARPEGCPLVPVPPHGRLGDLDKIENEIAQLSPEGYTTGMIRLILDSAPTIIPAEEGET